MLDHHSSSIQYGTNVFTRAWIETQTHWTRLESLEAKLRQVLYVKVLNAIKEHSKSGVT